MSWQTLNFRKARPGNISQSEYFASTQSSTILRQSSSNYIGKSCDVSSLLGNEKDSNWITICRLTSNNSDLIICMPAASRLQLFQSTPKLLSGFGVEIFSGWFVVYMAVASHIASHVVNKLSTPGIKDIAVYSRQYTRGEIFRLYLSKVRSWGLSRRNDIQGQWMVFVLFVWGEEGSSEREVE